MHPADTRTSLGLCAGTVADALDAHASQSPDAPYLTLDDKLSLTYGECGNLVHAVILPALAENPQLSALADHSSPQRRTSPRVAIISPNGPLLPLVHWALWSMNAVICPISTTAEPHLWLSMLEVLNPIVTLVSHTLVSRLESTFDSHSTNIPIVVLEKLVPGLELPCSTRDVFRALNDVQPKSHAIIPPHPSASPYDPAVILFTSSAVDNSTLKAVSYTHEIALHVGLRMTNHFRLTVTGGMPKHLGWLPLSHIFGLLVGLQ